MRAKRKPLPVARRIAGVVQACLIPMASPGKLLLRMQRQILSLLPPARLLLWAAWACEWDSTSPLTAELSLSHAACAYIAATHLMHAYALLHPTQHTPHLYQSQSNIGQASVSTLQLPSTGITIAHRLLQSNWQQHKFNHKSATY
jgi:hypothetical protein